MKMITVFSFLFLLCFSACQKDGPSLTQAQLTAQKLERDLGVQENVYTQNYQISVFSLTTNNFILINGTSFKITSDGFISVYSGGDSMNYNLGQLKYYKTDGNSNVILYF